MICEKCHVPLIERRPIRESEEAKGEKAVVFECPECGHTEDRIVISSFWRKLAA
jgi:RNase P subunit RPR2